MFDYKHSVIYQIWPRSFFDSSHDGIGDIQGIIRKLPYLKKLGVDAIWICPLYQSPNDDYGYDISDYYSINPEYGTMADLTELIHKAKDAGLQIIMDLVANHTSTKHKWFQEALKDPSSPYRDYYYFREGRNGQPPNNWLSFFGTSAWTKAEGNMYYLNLYAETQADLNWNNPAVRIAIQNIMNFYLDMGVSGFRMDTINTIDKKEGLPDKNPDKEGLQFADDYITDRENVRVWLKEINEKVLQPHDAFALGEGIMVTPEKVIEYTKPSHHELNMMFQFDLITLGYGELGKYDCRRLYHYSHADFKRITRLWQTQMLKNDGYIGNYLSNHDHQRSLNHFGDVHLYRSRSAKMLALYNFALYGTPFIYQGEEIAMVNPHLKESDWKDYECLHSCQAMISILGIPPFIAKILSSLVTRDNSRTPVQWNASANAGFTDAKPWMMVNPDYQKWNVEQQMNDPESVWNFYHRCIEIRRSHEALCTGDFQEILADHPSVLAFYRTDEKEKLLIIINLSKMPASIHLPAMQGSDILSNCPSVKLKEHMHLKPYEAHLFLIH